MRSGEVRFSAGAVGEDGVDERVGAVVYLSLGERPELDDLHSSRQRVGELAQREYLRGSGQQESPWPRVGVHGDLDGPEQLGRELDLIDY